MEYCEEKDQEERLIVDKALGAFGNLPGSMTLAVYNLVTDSNVGSATIRESSQFQTKRLVTVPAITVAITKFCEDYSIKWQEGALIPDLDPLSLAAIFFSVYTYKRLSKLCEEKEWEILSPQLKADMHIAVLIAKKYKPRALGHALFGTTAMYGAMGTFCAIHGKAFKEYRRRRKGDGFFSSDEVEFELLGCRMRVIARALMQRFRFGTEIAEAFHHGFDHSVAASQLNQSAANCRFVASTLYALYRKEKDRSALSNQALGLDQEVIEEIKSNAQANIQASWLE